jgi:hypothetical protein
MFDFAGLADRWLAVLRGDRTFWRYRITDPMMLTYEIAGWWVP